MDFPEKMLEALSLAEDIAPRAFEISYGKGIALFKLGKYNEALNEFLKAKNTSPYKPECYRNLAVTYFKLNDLKSAQDMLAKCLLLNPKDSRAKGYLEQIRNMNESTK